MGFVQVGLIMSWAAMRSWGNGSQTGQKPDSGCERVAQVELQRPVPRRRTATYWFCTGSPPLSARAEPTDAKPFLVEVYLKTMVIVRAKIRVDGKQIGGNLY